MLQCPSQPYPLSTLPLVEHSTPHAHSYCLITICAPVIYTALCIMFWMRASYTTRLIQFLLFSGVGSLRYLSVSVDSSNINRSLFWDYNNEKLSGSFSDTLLSLARTVCTKHCIVHVRSSVFVNQL
jgi:hypothetical protein